MKLPEDKSELSAAEVGKYLKKLAELHRDRNFGNTKLTSSLTDLANFLLKSRDCSVKEALENPKVNKTSASYEIQSLSFDDLSYDETIKIIVKESSTKEQLSTLGEIRFGISKSSLKKLSKEEFGQLIEEQERIFKNLFDLSDKQPENENSSKSSATAEI